MEQTGSSLTADGSPHPDMQITIMNSRVIALLAQTKERWALAGDQLYVDMELSVDNLPPGTRLRVGEAVVLEVTALPHNGAGILPGALAPMRPNSSIPPRAKAFTCAASTPGSFSQAW